MYTLNFIKRARSLGFSVDEVRDLLDLWRDKRRSSAKVKAQTSEHLKALDRKIAALQSMRLTLADHAERCRGADTTAVRRLADMTESREDCKAHDTKTEQQ